MRILHVIASLAPRYGGPSKACFEMARAVARLGHEVSIYTTNVDGPGVLDVPIGKAVVKDGVTITHYGVNRPRFWKPSIGLARALWRDIPKFDVIHIHSLYLFPNIWAGYVCRKHGIPYILRPHGTLDPFVRGRHRWRKRIMEELFEKWNFRGAGAVHFTTEEERALAKPYAYGARGEVAPLGVDFADYERLPNPGVFRDKFPETKGKKLVLYLGRISFKKGLEVLIEAFGKVAERVADAYLVVAGPDDEGLWAKFRARLRAKGLLCCVSYVGMLEGQIKLAALRDCSMFVLPSHSENFGIAVVEAMACGLPVVISDKVNIWPEIKKAQAGEVLPLDADKFADSLIGLFQNERKAEEMGSRGRMLVEQKYDWSVVGPTLERIYGNVIKRAPENIGGRR